MRRLFLLATLCLLFAGCGTVRKPQVATGPSFRIVTYNVNRGSNPLEIAEVIRANGADIVCLQEADNFETVVRPALERDYQTIKFREPELRGGGGSGFLSKFPAREIAWIPSATGWFGAWLLRFETPVGPVQILNVHLQPPYTQPGGWAGGYLFTRDDRRREIERFYSYCDPNIPLLVVGDFNDTVRSRAIRFLKRKGMRNALPQFDRRTPTWEWQTRVVKLRRRMDHIVYSPELDCISARVIKNGPSDHFPVEATIVSAGR